MRIASLVIGLLLITGLLVLTSAILLADDHNVNFDAQANFSGFKTFAIRDSRVTSERAELNNTIVVGRIHDSIREQLQAKGLKEMSTRPDILVSFSVAEKDYTVGPGGRANAIDPERGRRGRGGEVDPVGAPVDFAEGTLVIDMNTGEPQSLVWRGVYRDSEKNTVKLAKKMPGDAKKLLAEYPPKPGK